MNDNDLQLIVSLIGGELTAAEEQAARARIDADAELRTAYDEQRAVAALLAASRAAALTGDERDALRASLKSELRLGEAITTAPAPSRWERWRVPLAGLATAAAVLLAVVVVPDLIGGGGSAELADAPTALDTTGAPETTAAADFFGEAETDTGLDGQFAAPSTTAPAEAQEFSPTASSLMLVPVLDDPSLDLDELERAIEDVTGYTSINLDRIEDCLDLVGVGIAELSFLGVDGSNLLATYVDPDTGQEVVVSVALPSCAVTFP